MKRKNEEQKLSGTSVYLLYLLAELLLSLYVQGRIVLEPKWYGINLVIATIVYILLRLLIYSLKRLRLAGASLRKIDKMTGEEFEEYLGLLYDRKGYKVKYTPGTSDFGADLLLKKKGVMTVVQAKRYKNPVGEASVQQALSGKGYYDADQCMVITNSYFTPAAEALAERTGVTLIDRELLGTSRMYV
ncbi:MAG: restriction endonuclease [Lachnospiraceae bacterium]|nr:restriction endonuclease [Lachnospiraceae bacterium]